jgi:RTX calcium-binding nonapeptide repeat (4 copies)
MARIAVRVTLSLVVVLFGLAAPGLSGVRVAIADVGPAGLDDGDTIFVPLRWCAIEGSPAVTNPAGVGEPDTDNVLWRRHERATDNIWLPGARISFRSAMIREAFAMADFPIIPDPDRPPPGAGVEGDIDHSTSAELLDARAACLSAWDDLEMTLGVNIEGTVAINLRRFVNADGTTSNLAGFGTFSISYTGPNPCTGQIVSNNYGDGPFASVIDNSFTLPGDPHDALLAHELGHSLFLGHGNGLDDDADGFFDACDGQFFNASPPEESPTASPASLMTSGLGSEVVTTRQRGTTAASATGSQAGARGVAKVTSGTTFDPAANLLPGAVTADSRTDSVHDVTADAIDLVSAGISRNSVAKRIGFWHTLFGTIPREGRFRYLLFGDLDNDPGTGGAPSNVGFSTNFPGAELITSITVRSKPGVGRIVTPAVWRFEAGGFVKLPDNRITPILSRTVEQETHVALFDSATVEIPSALVPPVADEVRFEAVAQGPTIEGKGLDRLPDESLDVIGLPLFVAEPDFATAVTTPTHVKPGDTVTVDVEGLAPNAEIHLLLGPNEITKDFTGDDGAATIQFVVPSNAEVGLRLITVGILNAALTADSTVTVCSNLGTKANDGLKGTPQTDALCGIGGDDEIVGARGNDFVEGGPGDDRLHGGAGRDVVEGLAGNDLLVGGPGQDMLIGGPGKDTCQQDPGDKAVRCR